MKLMGKKYSLCNQKYSFSVENGILREAGQTAEAFQTVYVDETKGFGNLYLTWCSGEEKKRWEPFASEEFKQEEPVREGRSIICKGSAQKDGLRVEVAYTLTLQGLKQKITVANAGERPLSLLDFALRYACHTHFAWGENAGKEVMGHYFAAGNGSHATYYRCDGNGPILAVLPTGGSQWIYYDCPQEGEVQDKNTVYLYSLNAEAAQEAVNKGSRLRIPPESRELAPGGAYSYEAVYFLAANYEECREKFVQNGQVWAESVPGYTVPRDLEVNLCIKSLAHEVEAECAGARIEAAGSRGNCRFYKLSFGSLGEQCVTVRYDGKYVNLYYFVTQDIETLLSKRARFIASKQVRDPNKWYDGLLAEWNNETGVLLTPDCYDRIEGWRIYEVTCDDPGLSKPAFLSTKQTVCPVQEEVDALDYYIEHFVWGGLQQTEEEPYPYGIYGIPDWHTLRGSDKEGLDGQKHLWRIYDYPHIALLYYNMYLIAHEGKVNTRYPAKEYLVRAYRTALAMFLIPEELEGWSALKTGLYNELVIPEIIKSLERDGFHFEAGRLENFWNRKAAYFVKECRDVFGSEYPFDTTGFESTHVLAKTALKLASFEKNEDPWYRGIPYEKALAFMEKQTACNIACRGLLEPAYFWYGSDYRGGNMNYMLSYMSQMGGCSLLDYACRQAQDPFPLLRLAYGSLLSSYALLNTGDENSGYGYWFPGREHDGCAGGGFEPLALGSTWLGQEHRGGSWVYSCEIDLGFCGAVRGAAAVLALDPLFGRICYGGSFTEQEEAYRILSKDGVGRRFHYIEKDSRFHLEVTSGRFDRRNGIVFHKDKERIEVKLEGAAERFTVIINSESMGDWELQTETGVKQIVKDFTETVLELSEPDFILTKTGRK